MALANRLKTLSKGSVSFVGVIGSQHSSAFETVYAPSEMLAHQEVVITRNYEAVSQDSFLVPYRTLTHWKNYQLMRKLREKSMFDDLISKKVTALITVGNYSLLKRIFTEAANTYSESRKVKPPTFGFDLLNAYRSRDDEDYLDYLFYRLPKNPDNIQRYTFPSMCIGYEAVYQAFRHLQTFKEDSSDSSFDLPNFSHQIDELVRKARAAFRQQQGISQDTYITLLAPGNSTKEVDFSFKTFQDGFNKFLTDPSISSVKPDFFQLFVLVPSDPIAAEHVKQKVAALPSLTKVTLIQPADQAAAMCASDYAVIHSGEETASAAICQLPATVVSSMSNYSAYLSYLFNGHESAFNVAANYEGYEDLLGSLTAIG